MLIAMVVILIHPANARGYTYSRGCGYRYNGFEDNDSSQYYCYCSSSSIVCLRTHAGKPTSIGILKPDGTPERTLSKYHGNIETLFNPICGSSGFINGIVKRVDGRIERGGGIMQNLLEIEGIRPEQIDKEQFYLHVEGANK